MKRSDRDELHRRLRGAEASCAMVALGLGDPRPLGKANAQEMLRVLATAVVVIADVTIALNGVA